MEITEQSTDTKYQIDQIDWKAMENMGVSKERLEKLNLMDILLKGYKTNVMVPLTLKLGDAVVKLDARLSLQTNEDGKVVMAMHGIRKEPNLDFPYFGHEFTQEDKDNLLKSGNMGRIVELYNQKSGENVKSIISLDKKTNEIIAYPAEWMKIPDEIKSVKLNDQQKQTLQNGEKIYVEGMISKKGEPFNANIQFNADKRYVEFLFDNAQSKDKKQTKSESLETKSEQKESSPKKQNKSSTNDLKLKTPKSKGRKI